MAIYHLSAKVVSRGKGQSAIAAAAYRSGERLEDEQAGEQKFYEKRSLRIIYTDIMAPKHAPEWAHDRNRLWNEAERAEKRKDAQLAREIEVSLPHELTEQQREFLVKDFAREAFVRRGYVVDIAIHTPDRGGDLRNHHAHLMITMRGIGPDGFAPMKDRSLNAKAQLDTWREQWAHLANRHLARHGHDARVDHRSLEAQGIGREPTTHVGYAGKEMAARGAQSDRMDELTGILDRNGIRQSIRATDAELAELRILAANENRHARAASGRSREPGSMVDSPTDDQLHKQLDDERKYLKTMEFRAGRAEAVLAEQRQAQETVDRTKAFHQLKEQEAEEGRKKTERDLTEGGQDRNGDVSSASSRYSIALGQNYDVRDPYASLARAAGAEAAMFHKTQEQLRADAAKEADPDKRQVIDLRRKIEACDYMAITSDRLAGISTAVRGDANNPHAVNDRQQAAHWRAASEALREERGAVLDKVQAKEDQTRQTEEGRGDAARALNDRVATRPSYRQEMPATAPVQDAEPADKKTRTDGERAGEGSAMPAPRRGNYRELREGTARDARPEAGGKADELHVVEKDGRDVGPLSAFLQREQPRTSAPLQDIGMKELLKDQKTRGAYLRHELKMVEEQKTADKALDRIGSDLESKRPLQADDLRSMTREQWDSAKTKGEAGLVQSVREAKDRGSNDQGRGMGGPKPPSWEP